jgi:uncharacterized membrane protein YoaK (UPF0700 family)
MRAAVMAKIEEFARTAVLGLVAGSADAIAYVRYGTFVGAMTGNTVLLGIDLFGEQFGRAAYHACIIAVFLSMVALTQTAKISRIPAAVLLTATAILLLVSETIRSEWSAAISAAALGVQDATVRTFAGVSVNTVFVTGDLVQLGTAMPGAAEPKQRRQVDVLATVWLAYAAGAILGAAAVSFVRYPMAVPAVLALIAAASFRGHAPRRRAFQ